MKKRLAISITLITAVALILMLTLGILVTRADNYDYAEQSVKNYAEIYAAQWSKNGALTDVPDGIRVTVVASDGRVIADSSGVDLATMDNHLGREEIVLASQGKSETVLRDSDTLGEKLMYFALKTDIDNDYVFIRTAVTVKSVDAYVLRTLPIMIAILIAAVTFAAIASIVASTRILKPLGAVKEGLRAVADGRFSPVDAVTGDDEADALLREMNDVGEKLTSGVKQLSDEKAKLDYILDNISDGIVVFDGDCRIEKLNTRSRVIFGASQSVIGKGINSLTDDAELCKRVDLCASGGEDGSFELRVGAICYLCVLRRTYSGLTILVLSDVTASKEGEKMRSEFFANASHELKTPLTAIKGFDEMLTLQNKDAALDRYILQIAKEADRMLVLIEDMLKLSRLESTDTSGAENVDVIEVAEEVRLSLSHFAKEKGVRVDVDGEGTVIARREHVYELIKNLAENSVRYNDAGGYVRISAVKSACGVTVKVSDNGIGIAQEHRARIFERFYRVEKSRSRETGGTGLGLAIVKHVAELYNAEIGLNSTLGEGTEITVLFPAE